MMDEFMKIRTTVTITPADICESLRIEEIIDFILAIDLKVAESDFSIKLIDTLYTSLKKT